MSRTVHKRGLTLVELCIGMTITALVMSAVSAFSLAVGQQWRFSEHSGALRTTSTQSLRLITPVLQSAMAVGDTGSTGAARLFIWQADNVGTPGDGVAQLGEMSLVEFDPATGSIYLYEADETLANAVNNLLARQPLLPAQLNDAAIMSLFQQQTSMLKPRKTLLGPGRSTPDGRIITKVQDATFTRLNNPASPAVRLRLVLTRGDETLIMQPVLTLRAPVDPQTATGNGSGVGGTATTLVGTN